MYFVKFRLVYSLLKEDNSNSMKKLLFMPLIILTLLSINSVFAQTDSKIKYDLPKIKTLVTKLCTALKTGDRNTFESMLAEDSKQEMRWWWEASGKGKYFPKLFSRCEFDHVDKRFSSENNIKVFIQRYDLDGTKWSRPAPVSFDKNYKIISYSL